MIAENRPTHAIHTHPHTLSLFYRSRWVGFRRQSHDVCIHIYNDELKVKGSLILALVLDIDSFSFSDAIDLACVAVCSARRSTIQMFEPLNSSTSSGESRPVVHSRLNPFLHLYWTGTWY